MKSNVFLSIAAAILLSACTDEPETSRVTSEPTGPIARANIVAGGGQAVSTICTGYRKDLQAAQIELQVAPENTEVQEKVASLDAMVADACN